MVNVVLNLINLKFIIVYVNRVIYNKIWNISIKFMLFVYIKVFYLKYIYMCNMYLYSVNWLVYIKIVDISFFYLRFMIRIIVVILKFCCLIYLYY